MQGLLPCLAPLLPHLAEDAWESLPWEQPAKSIFQAGWFQTPANWTSLSQVTVLESGDMSTLTSECWAF